VSTSWKEAVEVLVGTANMETQTQTQTGEEDTLVSMMLASGETRLPWKEPEALSTVTVAAHGSRSDYVASVAAVDEGSVAFVVAHAVDDPLDIHNSPAEVEQQLVVDTAVAAAAAAVAAHVADRSRWGAEAEAEEAVAAKTW
jgi:hypothetical protein